MPLPESLGMYSGPFINCEMVGPTVKFTEPPIQ